ncbi:hypothetical protein K438DRAFT_1761399 [Mycena galopus ATCC 62051]|nr:hypothetical protein K438DRAFT_1761399 [Mycena galopus ATCC 62051]
MPEKPETKPKNGTEPIGCSLWLPREFRERAPGYTQKISRNQHLMRWNCLGKLSAYDFLRGLQKCTNHDGLDWPPDRRKPFMHIVREWREVKRMKRFKGGHEESGVRGTGQSELALKCRACPQPGWNLLEGWEKINPLYRFIYWLFLSQDANFRLSNRNVSSEVADPILGDGFGFFCKREGPEGYKAHITKHVDEAEMSSCSGFQAMFMANTKRTKGLRTTGVAGVTCARHNMWRGNGIGDLQVGERRKLEIDVRALKDPSVAQRLAFTKRHTALLRRIHKFRQVQGIYMPALRVQLSNEQKEVYSSSPKIPTDISCGPHNLFGENCPSIAPEGPERISDPSLNYAILSSSQQKTLQRNYQEPEGKFHTKPYISIFETTVIWQFPVTFGDDEYDGNGDQLPEATRLFMPSELSPSVRGKACVLGIAKIEARLRYGDMGRRARRSMLTMSNRYKLRNFTGQGLMTKGQGMLRQINIKIHAAKVRYCYTRATLLVLRGHGDWEKQLRVLADDDVRALNERALTAEEKAQNDHWAELGGAFIEGGASGGLMGSSVSPVTRVVDGVCPCEAAVGGGVARARGNAPDDCFWCSGGGEVGGTSTGGDPGVDT